MLGHSPQNALDPSPNLFPFQCISNYYSKFYGVVSKSENKCQNIKTSWNSIDIQVGLEYCQIIPRPGVLSSYGASGSWLIQGSSHKSNRANLGEVFVGASCRLSHCGMFFHTWDKKMRLGLPHVGSFCAPAFFHLMQMIFHSCRNIPPPSSTHHALFSCDSQICPFQRTP